jgi:hypothetical protein
MGPVWRRSSGMVPDSGAAAGRSAIPVPELSRSIHSAAGLAFQQVGRREDERGGKVSSEQRRDKFLTR